MFPLTSMASNFITFVSFLFDEFSLFLSQPNYWCEYKLGLAHGVRLVKPTLLGENGR